MTIVEKLKRDAQMIEMRKRGVSCAEIGKAFGLSKQRVSVILADCGYDGYFKTITESRCVYPNLRKWMNENRITIKDLCLRMYGNDLSENQSQIRHFMKGENLLTTRVVIDRFLTATGLTYEQLFSDKEIDTAHNNETASVSATIQKIKDELQEVISTTEFADCWSRENFKNDIADIFYPYLEEESNAL